MTKPEQIYPFLKGVRRGLYFGLMSKLAFSAIFQKRISRIFRSRQLLLRVVWMYVFVT